MRTYYQSDEYARDAEGSEFASITICGDEDGPHFVFGSGDDEVFDLAIPACEALAIAFALSRSAKRAIRAAEFESGDMIEPPTERVSPALVGELPPDPSVRRQVRARPSWWPGPDQLTLPGVA